MAETPGVGEKNEKFHNCERILLRVKRCLVVRHQTAFFEVEVDERDRQRVGLAHPCAAVTAVGVWQQRVNL